MESSWSSVGLRQIMSLDSPRVQLESVLCPLDMKKERPKLGSKSTPPMLLGPFDVKREVNKLSSSPNCQVLCSLCTHDEQLSIFSDPDHETHLRSLLGNPEDSTDLNFCSVCRHAMNVLFQLLEEIEEIGSGGIPTVVKPRGSGILLPPQAWSVKEKYGKSESPTRPPAILKEEEISIDNDLVICKEEPVSDDDDVDLTKLVLLREDVEDIECRIRVVVKLQRQQWPVIKGSYSLAQESPTKVVCKAEPPGDSDDEEPTPEDGFPGQTKTSTLRSRRGKGRKTKAPVVYPRKCHACSLELTTKSRYDHHMSRVHIKGNAKKVDIDSLPPILTTQDEGGRTLHCCPIPKCGTKCTQRSGLPGHLATAHGLKVELRKYCPVCKKGFHNKEIFKAHTHPDKGDPAKVSYTCGTCGKVFATGYHLTRHNREFHGKKHHGTCPHCGKSYRKKQSLVFHIRTCSSAPNQEEMRTCGCGAVFSNGAELLDHERVVHQGRASIKCYFCSKIFTSETNMAYHIRSHTRESPYVCLKCGQGFAYDGNMKRHMATKCGMDEKKGEEIRRRGREYNRKATAKRPKPSWLWPGRTLYDCPECGKPFTSQSGVLSHQVRAHGLHKPKKKYCPVCRRGFWSIHFWKAHTHPDKKDPSRVVYICQLCDAVLASPSTLLKHEKRIHLKKFPKDCSVCGKVFSKGEDSQRHIRVCVMAQGGKSKCHCGKVFDTKAERLDHARMFHKGGNGATNKCYFCYKILSDEAHFYSHMRIHTRERVM